MVDLECPWCGETGLLPLLDPERAEGSFTCEECGTTVELAEEPLSLELAA